LDWPAVLAEVRAALPAEVRVWLVGGAVRDALLNRRLRDLDFVAATDGRGLARAVADRLGGAYYPLDQERGVGRALVTRDDQRLTLDFARLRGADLHADLAARDFTLNALAVDLAAPDAVIDPLGGQADLRAKLIRACGPTALADDPVRAVRAVRLAAHLGFRLDPALRAAARAAGPGLGRISAERRRDELIRCVGGPRAAAAARVLHTLELWPYLIAEVAALPGLNLPPPIAGSAWEHALSTLGRLEDLLSVLHPVHDVDAASDLTLGLVSLRLGRHRDALAAHLNAPLSDERPARWLLMLAALLRHTSGLPDAPATIVRDIAARLRLSIEEGRRLAAAVDGAGRFEALAQVPVGRREVFRYFQALEAAGVDGVLLGLAGHLGAQAGPAPADEWNACLDAASTLLRAYFENPDEAVHPPALLTGDDLMAELGLRPGPRLGRLLADVYEAQAAGEVDDRASALAFARRALDQG
jgi:tRNA nucleotidyltransferase/poly(A) polymerase